MNPPCGVVVTERLRLHAANIKAHAINIAAANLDVEYEDSILLLR